MANLTTQIRNGHLPGPALLLKALVPDAHFPPHHMSLPSRKAGTHFLRYSENITHQSGKRRWEAIDYLRPSILDTLALDGGDIPQFRDPGFPL